MSSDTIPSRQQFYADLYKQAQKLIKTTNDGNGNAANISSLLYNNLQRTYGTTSCNWIGFYYSRPKHTPEPNSQYFNVLVLGPFHGEPAVTEIPYTRGVCGSCARNQSIELVGNVHEREDHIACDSKSQSELIFPIFSTDSNGTKQFIGELDMDCPVVDGYTQDDINGIQPIIELLQTCDWSFVNIPFRNSVIDDDIPACTARAH